jgi:hypothetical protein
VSIGLFTFSSPVCNTIGRRDRQPQGTVRGSSRDAERSDRRCAAPEPSAAWTLS